MYRLILNALGEESEINKVIAYFTKNAKPIFITSEKELDLHIQKVLGAMNSETWAVGSVVPQARF
jgi:hypothetical protein